MVESRVLQCAGKHVVSAWAGGRILARKQVGRTGSAGVAGHWWVLVQGWPDIGECLCRGGRTLVSACAGVAADIGECLCRGGRTLVSACARVAGYWWVLVHGCRTLVSACAGVDGQGMRHNIIMLSSAVETITYKITIISYTGNSNIFIIFNCR